MRMPMIAKIVHTAKQIVNAMVDIHSAVRWSAGVTSGRASMVASALFARNVDPPTPGCAGAGVELDSIGGDGSREGRRERGKAR